MSEPLAAPAGPETPPAPAPEAASERTLASYLPHRAGTLEALPQYRARVQFTGRGSEYFRIWIVHLLLMLLTLGLYSPWAKVRKMRWFAQNTRLLGDRFDFHADPRRILVGRLLALSLLSLWWLGFEWSATLGWFTVGLLLLIGPALFASAQRFRLGNLSWRGLRFGFSPPTSAVYLAGVPALAVWLSGTVVQQLALPTGWMVVAVLCSAALVPLVHARIKSLQHRHTHFGGRRFSFLPGLAGELTAIYIVSLVLVVGSGIATFLAVGLLSGFANLFGGGKVGAFVMPFLISMGVGLCVIGVGYPYAASRVQQAVWGRTKWQGVRFEGRMQARQLRAICFKQGMLVLLTAGLYWPWASVALARYRLQSMVVISDTPLRSLAAQAVRDAAPPAIGDAAADLFGLDVGW